jgi:mono/diheme cytochrome c family protein
VTLALALLLAQAATPRTSAGIWQMKCKSCHGEDGRSRTKKGRKFNAPDFTTGKWQNDTTDEEIYIAIHDGVPRTKMPSFKAKLSEEEIQAMVPYLRAFAGKK